MTNAITVLPEETQAIVEELPSFLKRFGEIEILLLLNALELAKKYNGTPFVALAQKLSVDSPDDLLTAMKAVDALYSSDSSQVVSEFVSLAQKTIKDDFLDGAYDTAKELFGSINSTSKKGIGEVEEDGSVEAAIVKLALEANEIITSLALEILEKADGMGQDENGRNVIATMLVSVLDGIVFDKDWSKIMDIFFQLKNADGVHVVVLSTEKDDFPKTEIPKDHPYLNNPKYLN